MIISKLVHWVILPCSEISLLIEKKTANELSMMEKLRLAAHLRVCEMCRAYQQKVAQMDNLLKKWVKKEKNDSFETTEIQHFQDKMNEKLKK